MNERTVHPIDYLGVLDRRKWWFIVTFAVCAVGRDRAGALPATGLPIRRDGRRWRPPDRVVGKRRFEPRRSRRARSPNSCAVPSVLDRVAREEGLTAERPIEEAKYDIVAKLDVELPKPITHEGDQALNAFEIVYRDGTADGARRVAEPPGAGVRRRAFAEPRATGRRHRRVLRRTDPGQSGTDRQARIEAADGQGTAHGQTAGADAGQPGDSCLRCVSSSKRPATTSARSRTG